MRTQNSTCMKITIKSKQFSLHCYTISKDDKDVFIDVSLPLGMAFGMSLFLFCSL